MTLFASPPSSTPPRAPARVLDRRRQPRRRARQGVRVGGRRRRACVVPRARRGGHRARLRRPGRPGAPGAAVALVPAPVPPRSFGPLGARRGAHVVWVRRGDGGVELVDAGADSRRPSGAAACAARLPSRRRGLSPSRPSSARASAPFAVVAVASAPSARAFAGPSPTPAGGGACSGTSARTSRPPSLSLDVVVAEAAEDAGAARRAEAASARVVSSALASFEAPPARPAPPPPRGGRPGGGDVVLAVDDALAATPAAHAVRTASDGERGGVGGFRRREGFADTGFAVAAAPSGRRRLGGVELGMRVAPALHDARAVRRVVDATLNGGRDYFGSEAVRFGGGDSATTIAFAPPAVAVAGPFPPAVSESAARRAAASAGFFLVARGSEAGARARSTPASLSRAGVGFVAVDVGRRVGGEARWFGRPGRGRARDARLARPRSSREPSIAPGGAGRSSCSAAGPRPAECRRRRRDVVAFSGTSGGASGGVSRRSAPVSSAVALAETPASPPGVDATARAAGDSRVGEGTPRTDPDPGRSSSLPRPAFVASVSPSRRPTEGGDPPRALPAPARQRADAPLWCRVGVVAPVAARRWADGRGRRVPGAGIARGRGGGVRVGEPAGLPRGGRERRAKGAWTVFAYAPSARASAARRPRRRLGRGRRRAAPPSRWRRPPAEERLRGRRGGGGVVRCACRARLRAARRSSTASRAPATASVVRVPPHPDPFIEGFFPVLVDDADAAGAAGVRSAARPTDRVRRRAARRVVAAGDRARWRRRPRHPPAPTWAAGSGRRRAGCVFAAGQAAAAARRDPDPDRDLPPPARPRGPSRSPARCLPRWRCARSGRPPRGPPRSRSASRGRRR